MTVKVRVEHNTEIKAVIKSRDLARHLLERANHHFGRAKHYAKQAGATPKSPEPIPGQTVIASPADQFRQRQRYHEQLGDWFEFLGRHLDPKPYALTQHQLRELEMIR